MIHLSDGYCIDVSGYNYTVGIPKKQIIENKKTGESKETIMMTDAKHYTTLDKALVGWWRTMRSKALSNFDGSLNEAMELVKKQDEQMLNIISGIEINNTKLMEETNERDESNPNASDTKPSPRGRRGRKQLL